MKKILFLLLFLAVFSSCTTTKTIYFTKSDKECDTAESGCFYVKENYEDEWLPFKDSIFDFHYQEGYTYKLEIKTKEKDPTFYQLKKIIYKELKPADQQDIPGNWKVTELTGTDTIGKYPTMFVDLENQKISGNAGCNRYSASFSIQDNKIHIKNTFSTKRYCSHMAIEEQFFELLKKVALFDIINKNLVFFSANGKKLISCSRTDE